MVQSWNFMSFGIAGGSISKNLWLSFLTLLKYPSPRHQIKFALDSSRGWASEYFLKIDAWIPQCCWMYSLLHSSHTLAYWIQQVQVARKH